jgi:Ran GTPase-activating protein (RanGAP) involved in mRNA processing and transport
LGAADFAGGAKGSRPATAASNATKKKATAHVASHAVEQYQRTVQDRLKVHRRASTSMSALSGGAASLALRRPSTSAAAAGVSAFDAAIAVFQAAPNVSGKPMLLVGTPAPNGESVLARPMSYGLQVATAYATFDELASRRIWAPPTSSDASYISHDDVDKLYDARCRDQHSESNPERRCRFHAYMNEACKGSWMVLREAGMGAESVSQVAAMLSENERITHLDLSGNDVGVNGAHALAELLATNDTLCVLRLQSANLGDGSRVLANALKRNNTLTALDLSGIGAVHRNCIWGSAAGAIAEMLFETPVLAYLDLGSCGLQRATAEVLRGATHTPSLTFLGLAGNNAGDHSCCALRSLLSDGSSDLRVLQLQQNGIGPRGLAHISAGFGSGGRPASTLSTVDLSDNVLSGIGLEDFAASWKHAPSLTHVNLSGNKLCEMGTDLDGFRLPESTDGLAAMFAALLAGAQIKKLCLARCNIKALPPSEKVMAGLGADACTLKLLDISGNSFGDDGAAIVAAGLRVNTSITTLRLTMCQLTTAGVASVAAGAAEHPALQHLSVAQTGRVDYDAAAAPLTRSRSLLTVDFPPDVLRNLASRLEANADAKRREVVPKLAETRRQVYTNQRLLSLAQERLVSEGKAKERLVEQSRVRRERQKAQSIVFRAELGELVEQRDRQQHDVDTRELELRALEDSVAEERRTREAALNRVKMQLERQQQLRQDAAAAASRRLNQHYQAHPTSTVAPPFFVKVSVSKASDGAPGRQCIALTLAQQQQQQQQQQHLHNSSMGFGTSGARDMLALSMDSSVGGDSTDSPQPARSHARRRSSTPDPHLSSSIAGLSISTAATAGNVTAASLAAGSLAAGIAPPGATDPEIEALTKQLEAQRELAGYARTDYERAQATVASLEAVIANGGRPLLPAAPELPAGKGRRKTIAGSLKGGPRKGKASLKAVEFVASASLSAEKAKTKKGGSKKGAK